MIERIDFTRDNVAEEISIHLNRYDCTRYFVQDKKVLDIACGVGYGSKLMKEFGAKSVVGVDASEVAISNANDHFKADGVDFFVGHCEKLDFPDMSFDVIVSLETIEHLNHPEIFLSELKRVLIPGGTVIISCPNDPYFKEMNPNYENIYHKREYKWFEFQELTEKCFGKANGWFYGFQLGGFVTLPIQALTFPNKLSQNFGTNFYQSKKMIQTRLVQPDQFVNYWNASYFLGIWTSAKLSCISNASIYPKPQEDLFTLIEKLKKENKDLKTKLEQANNIH